MRSYEEIAADAKDQPAFSNSTEYDMWAPNWCEVCTKDSPEMVDRGEGCPLILIALMDQTPKEWTPDPGGDFFLCSEFERRNDDGPDDDGPEPPDGPGPFAEEMPGQLDIFSVFADQAIDAFTVAPERVGVPT